MNVLQRALIAGAAGTLALEIVGYGDMLLRGRPASDVPAKSAAALAQRLRLPAPQAARADALGALLGYTDGLGFALAYARLRPRLALSWPLAGALLGIATLAPEFVAARLGATDPRRWGVAGWLAGLVPRAAYGLVTAAVTEHLT